jgi:hypothetical protein
MFLRKNMVVRCHILGLQTLKFNRARAFIAQKIRRPFEAAAGNETE